MGFFAFCSWYVYVVIIISEALTVAFVQFFLHGSVSRTLDVSYYHTSVTNLFVYEPITRYFKKNSFVYKPITDVKCY